MTASRVAIMRASAFGVALVALGAVAWFETHHAIPAFRAWSFAATFVLIAALTVIAPARLRGFGLSLATLVAGIFVLELAALALEPKAASMTITPRWLVLRPEVGFGFDRSMVVHSRKVGPRGNLIFDAQYTIGPTFDRVVRSAPAGPATVFFGDSYTFGEGLDDADTLPQRYADLLPGRRVLNLAITGYSPQQFLREVETGLRDKVIGSEPAAFVFLTSPFHAARTACKETWTNNAPRYALVDGTPAYQGVCYSGAALAWQEYRMNTALYRVAVRPYLSRLTHADVALYIEILAKAVRVAHERYGVDTLVPFVKVAPNYLQGTGWTNESVLSALQARGVRAVDMTLPQQPAQGYAIKDDGHPTGAANLVRARTIADLLAQQGSARAAELQPSP